MGNFLGILYSKKRVDFKKLNKQFKNVKNGDFVINVVKRKNKQGLTNEYIHKIIKIDFNDWIYYKVTQTLYKEIEGLQKD